MAVWTPIVSSQESYFTTCFVMYGQKFGHLATVMTKIMQCRSVAISLYPRLFKWSGNGWGWGRWWAEYAEPYCLVSAPNGPTRWACLPRLWIYATKTPNSPATVPHCWKTHRSLPFPALLENPVVSPCHRTFGKHDGPLLVTALMENLLVSACHRTVIKHIGPCLSPHWRKTRRLLPVTALLTST